MDMTTRLSLPLLSPGQAQKELFHNEALQVLDSLVAAAVEDGPLNDPPSNPAVGSCYLLGSSPTSAWAGFADHVAAYSDAGWRFIAPTSGMTVFVEQKAIAATFVAGAWELGSVRASRMMIGGEQVVGPRAAAIPDPSGGASVDPQGREAIAAILSTLRQHGLISP